MMSGLHYNLNLPLYPLNNSKNWTQLAHKKIDNMPFEGVSYVFFDPHEVLSGEVIRIFNTIDIKLKCVVVFSGSEKNKTRDDAKIHNDVWFDNGAWKNVCCGVTWELGECDAFFNWWDMSSFEKVIPVRYPTVYDNLRGVYYKNDKQIQAKYLIESVHVTQPTLVRTDIPHSVNYKYYGDSQRTAVSLRFHERNMSWVDLVSVLNPIIQK